jgi:hypothetical protein
VLDRGIENYYLWWRENAHRLNIPILYLAATKYELLPKEKVADKNVRLFCFGNVLNYFDNAQDHQHFNKCLEHIKFWYAYGTVMQKGGVDKLVRKLDRIPGARKYVMGDCSKWDKRFRTFLLKICKDVRVRLYKGNDIDGYKLRVEYQYKNETYTFLMLSNGQVIFMMGSQKSGRVNTTTDNCVAHNWIIFAMVLYHCDISGNMTWMDIVRLLEYLIYADDHLAAFGPDLFFLTSFDKRSEFYGWCGMQLKLEDDRVQDTVEGMTFLGGKIMLYHGSYVPQYNVEKIRASIIFSKKMLTDNEEFGKALCLLLLSAFIEDEVFYETLEAYTMFCHSQAKGWLSLPDDRIDVDTLRLVMVEVQDMRVVKVPTRDEVRSFWTGHEAALNVVHSGQCTQSSTCCTCYSLCRALLERISISYCNFLPE